MLKHLCNHQVWLWYLDLSQVFLVSVLIWEIMSNQLSRLCILNSSPRNLESHLGLDLSSWTSLLTDRAPSHKPNSPPEDTATMISIIHHAYSQETQRGTFPKLGWILILLQNRYKNYPHLSDPAYRQQKKLGREPLWNFRVITPLSGRKFNLEDFNLPFKSNNGGKFIWLKLVILCCWPCNIWNILPSLDLFHSYWLSVLFSMVGTSETENSISKDSLFRMHCDLWVNSGRALIWDILDSAGDKGWLRWRGPRGKGPLHFWPPQPTLAHFIPTSHPCLAQRRL